MKKYNEILMEIDKTRDKLNLLNEEEDSIRELAMGLSLKEKLPQKTMDRLAVLEKETADLELMLKYLKNNAKIVAFNEFVPIVLKVWNKYINKPCGPKTEQKIKDEIRALCNCHFYVDGGFHVVPLNKQGYSSGYDFVCGTKYTNGKRKPLLVNNKIQVVEFTDFELWYSNSTYVEDIPKTIEELRRLKAKAIEKQNELEKICSKFNTLTVNGIDNIYYGKQIYQRL